VRIELCKLAQAAAEDDSTVEDQMLLQDRNTLMKKARIKQLYKEKKLAEAYAVFANVSVAEPMSKGKSQRGVGTALNNCNNSTKIDPLSIAIPQLLFMAKSLIDAQDFVLKQKEPRRYQTKHVFINSEIPEEVFDEDEVMRAFKKVKYPLVAAAASNGTGSGN
jgi:hypothetical protein